MRMKVVMAGIAVCLGVLGTNTASAAELLMLHRPGCVWCMKFEAEIAPAYPRTREGAIAPLRRVDVSKTWPSDLSGIQAEPFTPTFILVEDGREVSRIRGYAGDQFFWFLLDEMIAKLPTDKAPANLPQS